jgi:glycosyltransferase involved in cell wall biosynthesis
MCTNRADAQCAAALRSVLEQTFRDFELVLVCNGMGDGDFARIASWCEGGRVRLIRSRYRLLTNNLNIGLHECAGAYVARMDADDVALPDRLAVQARFLDANPAVGVCGTFFELIDDAGQSFRTVRYPEGDVAIRRALFSWNPLCHPSVMFRRDVVLDAGGYMGGPHAEDYDLWVRLVLAGATRFANVPQVLLGYRASPSGAARRAAAAYASVTAAQARAFVLSGDPRWLAGSLLTAAKRLFRSRQ